MYYAKESKKEKVLNWKHMKWTEKMDEQQLEDFSLPITPCCWILESMAL